MAPNPEQTQLVNDLIALQPRLRAYIYAQVADWSVAEDLLQQTNMVVWTKAEESSKVDSLKAWAYRVAKLEVMGWRKKQSRDRLRFSEPLVERIADAVAAKAEQIDERRAALEQCIARLSDEQQQLLNLRYGINAQQHTPQELARTLDRPVGSIRQTLYRLRAVLMECISSRTRSGGYES